MTSLPATSPPSLPWLGELGCPTDAAPVAERLDALAPDVVLGGEVDGDVVGVAVCASCRCSSARRLVVGERVRGRGVDAALVAEAERRAAAAGCWRLLVLSGRDRADAHAYYRHLGFDERTRAFARVLEPPA